MWNVASHVILKLITAQQYLIAKTCDIWWPWVKYHFESYEVPFLYSYAT